MVHHPVVGMGSGTQAVPEVIIGASEEKSKAAPMMVRPQIVEELHFEKHL